jgi:hypothetical protein
MKMPVTEVAFDTLKERVIEVEQTLAVREEAMKSIVDRLTKIETILSRLTWLLVTGIGGGVVAFLVSGGFYVSNF